MIIICNYRTYAYVINRLEIEKESIGRNGTKSIFDIFVFVYAIYRHE